MVDKDKIGEEVGGDFNEFPTDVAKAGRGKMTEPVNVNYNQYEAIAGIANRGACEGRLS